MRFEIDKTDLQRVRREFEQFSLRRFESGLAEALNKTAAAVAVAWRAEIAAKIQGPTALTRRAVQVQRADVGRLVAVVGLRPDGADIAPAEYLEAQEFGAGDRRAKKFERALQASGAMPEGWRVVPGKGAKLDGFGNIARGQIVQVLNQLGARLSVGYQQVVSKDGRRRQRSAARAGRVYIAFPRQVGKVRPGVYEKQDRALVPVFYFVSSTTYKKRTGLIQAAQVVISAKLEREVRDAMERRLKSLQARG